MNTLKQYLFGGDPFVGFDPEWARPDLDGPIVDYSQLIEALKTIRPKTVVIVGARKGAAAVEIGNFCRAEELTPEIVCIDSWLGSPRDLYNKTDEQRQENAALLRQVNGFPMMYFTFMRNIVDAGLQEIITPLPQTSENAAKILRHYDVRIGVAYMDNEPEPQPLYRELMFYSALMDSPSMMVGNNAAQPGIMTSLTKFSERTGHKFTTEGNKYVLAHT